MANAQNNAPKTVAQNKKALHDYFVLESYEAGIELCGTEVKSVRAGRINLKDAWCSIVEGEMFVNGMHISPYDHGNILTATRCACESSSCTSARSCAFTARPSSRG